MSKMKTGKDWTYKIYFYPNSHAYDGGTVHPISADELVEKLSTLLDVEEDILEVFVYKSALTRAQATKAILCHLYVVFRTKDWWWSIEKNCEGITIQRHRDMFEVKDKYRHQHRTQYKTIALVTSDEGKRNILELIKMLRENDELNHKYNYLDSNCKHFTKVVFDYTAKTKTYDFVI